MHLRKFKGFVGPDCKNSGKREALDEPRGDPGARPQVQSQGCFLSSGVKRECQEKWLKNFEMGEEDYGVF